MTNHSMQYRRLGNSDLQISAISLGCMSLGTTHKENERILHAALDQGINFFDTADLYDEGENEKSLGKAFSGRRDKVIIATKVGNQLLGPGQGWDWNPSKDYIKRTVHQSLKRLNTDYIDLYQLHGGTIEDPVDETIEAFEELKEEGYIRHYGISSIRPNTIRAWVEKSHLVSVMTQYSLLDRRPEEFTLGHLQAHDVGVLVRGALAKGFLLDKEPMDMLGHSEDIVSRCQQYLAQLADEHHSPAQIALQFALAHPAVTTIVTGASSVAQIKENAAAGHSPTLPSEIITNLRGLTEAFQYEQHR